MRISDWSSDVCSSDLHVGARRHMLAAAEADFEMQRAVVTEQRLGGHRSLGRHRDLRQQAVDQLLLAGAQGLALGAAIKAVEGGRVAGFVSGHGARPSRPPRHTASVRTAPAFAGATRIITEKPHTPCRTRRSEPTGHREREWWGKGDK